MADLGGFNANEHKPMDTLDPLEPGEYLAMLVDSEMRDTRSGEGRYLALEFQVLDGDSEGRKLWTNLNLVNPSAKSVEIAQRELAAICKAVGVDRPQDSAELHDKPLMIKVGVTKRKDTGDLANRIKGYKAAEGQVTAKASGGAKQGGLPWKRK